MTVGALGRFLDRRAVAAVEFALIAPLLIAFFFGIIVYATVLATTNGLQQLAAEAARATVAGLNDTERASIARAFVTANIASYPFLTPSKLTVTTTSLSTPTPAFKITLAYDLSTAMIYQFRNLVPMPAAQLQRSAIVVRGAGT